MIEKAIWKREGEIISVKTIHNIRKLQIYFSHFQVLQVVCSEGVLKTMKIKCSRSR